MLRDEVTTESNLWGNLSQQIKSDDFLSVLILKALTGCPTGCTRTRRQALAPCWALSECYKAQATFFVVGGLAEEHPRGLSARSPKPAMRSQSTAITDADDLSAYDGGRLARLDDDPVLGRIPGEDMTGKRPVVSAHHICWHPISTGPRSPSCCGLTVTIGIFEPRNTLPGGAYATCIVPIHELGTAHPPEQPPKLARSPVLLAALNAGPAHAREFRPVMDAAAPVAAEPASPVHPRWPGGSSLVCPPRCDLLGMPASWQGTHRPRKTAPGYARAVVAAAAMAPGVDKMASLSH